MPFLIGLPSLFSMRATINFKYKSLGLHIGSDYTRIHLDHGESHILLPFSSKLNRVKRGGKPSSSGSTSQYKTSIESHIIRDKPSDTTNHTDTISTKRAMRTYLPGGHTSDLLNYHLLRSVQVHTHHPPYTCTHVLTLKETILTTTNHILSQIHCKIHETSPRTNYENYRYN